VTTGEDNEDVAWSDSDTEKQQQQQTVVAKPTPDAAVSGPKRRRGKRKVMKKRTTKDEDGYLVTKEEAVWESYSEDEPEAPEPAAAAVKKEWPRSSLGANKAQSQGGKGAGGAGKAGPKKGGNIMSFFGKKN